MTPNMNGRLRMPISAAVTAIACALSAPIVEGARADPGRTETRSIKVRYDDLDLAKEAGIQRLYQRLRLAARQVCGSPDTRRPADVRDWRRCVDQALGTAVTELGNARLTAVHVRASGGDGTRPVAMLR
jgi:UrcA family protein